MCPWSKSSWTCHPCKTNYNRQCERNGKDPVVRRWWRGMPKIEKTAWFKKNKATYEPNKKHSFDDAGVYAESSKAVSHVDDDNLYRYIPQDDWILREMQLGRCGDGLPREQYQVGLKKWEAALMERQTRKRQVGEVWLMGIYAGVEVRVGTSQQEEQSLKRQRTVQDSVDQSAVDDLRVEAAKATAQWLEQHQASASSGIDLSNGSTQVQVPDGLVRGPQPAPAPGSELAGEINREVLLAMQRQAKIAEQEEADDHDARQADKIAKTTSAAASVGRPRKQESQLMAEASKVIRDRQGDITEAENKVKREANELSEEVKKKLNPLPEDLQTIEETMKTEIKDHMAKLKKVSEALAAVSVEQLVKEAASDSDALKKKIVNMIKPMKTHVANANKSMQAFRAAAKAALKKSKKGKGAQAVPLALPPLTAGIVGQLNNRDSVNVIRQQSSLRLSNPEKCYLLVLPDESVTAFIKQPGLAQTAKWLRKQVTNEIDPSEAENKVTTAMASYRPALAKAINKLAADQCKGFYTRLQLPSEYESLRDEVFGAQHWILTEPHVQTGFLPHAVSEVRLLLGGSYYVAGVKVEHMPGDTLKAKLEGLMTSAGQTAFANKAIDPAMGYCAVHDESGTCMVIPAGYITLVSGSHSNDEKADGAHGIRWGLLDASSQSACKACLAGVNDILATYPQLASNGYESWKECLTKYLIPSSTAAP